MTVKELKNEFHKELNSLYPKTEIASFFFLSIEEYLKFKKIDTVLQSDFRVSNDQLELFTETINRLKKEEPIQYILGKTEFYGLPFFVNKNTLIPRPETEELVTLILESIKSNGEKQISILDIGTGSGCIPIALKKNTNNSKITAIDISSKALKVAKKNAELNNVSIHFKEIDILKTYSLSETYDVIISNPPYVRELEKEEMNKNVLNYEPQNALFVEDNNPLIFYDKISRLAKNHLVSNGVLFFEINEYLGEETKQLMSQIGFKSVELKKDIFGKDRMIKALK